MLKYARHIALIVTLLCALMHVQAQTSMPDTVCIGTARIYQVNDPSVKSAYTWKLDGVVQSSTTNEFHMVWLKPGVFLLSVQEHGQGGCDGDERTGLVYVQASLVADAGPDTTICFGSTVHLNGSGGRVYHWAPSTNLSNPNISNPLLHANREGTFTYFLDVSDGSCPSKADTVSITILPPLKISAGSDTMVSSNQPVQLKAVDLSGARISQYSWSPSFGLSNPLIQDPVAILDADMTYVVTARTVEGCEAKDEINIKVFHQADLFVPTAFTPNGDGLNDILRVIPVGIKELKYFSVYNRWGELVFTTRDYTKGWDGNYHGRQQGNFAFVWMAEGIDYEGHVINRKGTVVLIR
ncbi:MAG: gliding motility-associated C-terminal domain-containing protein [Flavisolibacter sp.]